MESKRRMRKFINLLGVLPTFIALGLACVLDFSCAKQEKGGLDAELMEMLDNTDYVNIEFGGKYMGYQVRAEIHSDDENHEVGMARFFFTNSSGTVVIDTPYYWDWEKEIRIRPSSSQGGEAPYWVAHIDNAVQGGETEIECVRPFCFKDVDFDGVREICFSTIGYNRVYYSVFKLISDTHAVRMSEAPFSRIVYGEDNTRTTFDYDQRTISINEIFGVGDIYSAEYVRRRIVMNPLKPMRLVKETK